MQGYAPAPLWVRYAANLPGTLNPILSVTTFNFICFSFLFMHEFRSKRAQHSNVRWSHAHVVAKLKARSSALSELLHWKCGSTCTTDCLGYVERVDAQRDFWLDVVMEMRRTTCLFAEQQPAGHIRSVLKTLLRTSVVWKCASPCCLGSWLLFY
jgi:hypothetical protein